MMFLLEGLIEGSGDYSGLKPSQVVVGLPATKKAAGSGYVKPKDVNQALNCLKTGQNCQGYKPQKAYPNLRGVMTWDVNWDAANQYNWANTIEPCVKNDQC